MAELKARFKAPAPSVAAAVEEGSGAKNAGSSLAREFSQLESAKAGWTAPAR